MAIKKSLVILDETPTPDKQPRDMPDSRLTETYIIEGMDCGSCALTLEKHLQSNPAVKKVSVNFSTGKMAIEHGSSAEEIIQEVSKAGFRAAVESNERTAERKKDKSAFHAVVGSGTLLALGIIGSYAGSVSANLITVLYGLAIAIGGYKPARSAYYAIKSRSLDMNVLMSAAVIGAAIIGEMLEGATVVWLFALGNMLQSASIERTRNSIRSLLQLTPPVAQVKIGNERIEKAVRDVAVGDIIVVNPGDSIPLDGKVSSGDSSVNQAPITGESIPVDKQVGDTVFAGSINEHGMLEITVTKRAMDTALAKIIHLVEEAQAKKAPTEAIVDKFARMYTPIVFVLAVLVMLMPPLFGLGLWSEWFYKGLELLVIACPCALVISTPIAIVSAIGNAARTGVLIKGGVYLEIAGKLSAIAFDKTGTLTEGKPSVVKVIAPRISESELLSIASTLEQFSTHPIAKAVVQYAEQHEYATLQARGHRNITGKGVTAEIEGRQYFAGNMKLVELFNTPLGEYEHLIALLQQEGHSIVIIGSQNEIVGILAIADTVREASVKALSELQNAGVKEAIMLTGDHEGTANHIASLTGISRYYADLLPENKVEAIKQLQSHGHKVAMVGDGINDAPALAAADLGIAMGGAGSDTAMETADIVLMADHLEKLPYMVKLSRKTLGIIKQNIWFSILIKAAALVLIFPNVLTLWIAIISDTGAALIVILNSMRLLRFKG
ncbi:heavy metal translocating P-type ATPase [Paenibacillus harenae]|uniref:Cd(2+)-exporting ATPase n=1 Tax=Paenibacillus harenae TaxID=306543 RepID=A0ABT9UCR7_PAEHA|nr:cation-translocating P-type ATPase [Paenibacillus harenae]MDQ0116234.1 Cd2+/Zn2+-exporting ATPase [Paenibacillus harenae]